MAKERHPLAPAAAPQPPPQHSAHHPHSHPHSHPPANITVVRTARELQEASLRGALDIEIRAHLDLRTLDLAQDPSGLFSGTVQEFGRRSLLYADLSMRSIRVRAPNSTTLEPGAPVARLGLHCVLRVVLQGAGRALEAVAWMTCIAIAPTPAAAESGVLR